MASENRNFKQFLIAKIIFRFLGGAALGIFLLIIPYSLSAIELNLHDVVIAALVIILCGLVSSVLGKSFIASLMQLFESSVF